MLNARALLLATTLGTILQVAMVVAGHSNTSIAALFAVGGMGFSLIAGLAYAMWARGGRASALALGGLVAGALCALIGIFVSYMLGDVPMSLLALGTISSAVTGAIGGWLGTFLFRARVAAAIVVGMAAVAATADAQTMTSAANAPHTLATTADFTWLVGRWEGRMTGSDGDVFENAVGYDKALMSTQPRAASRRRIDPDSFVGHSDIIGSDGKPGVVEVTYRRVR
jgi:hypothetical protein